LWNHHGVSENGATLRIALYSGILVKHDAVSNSLILKVKILQDLCRSGADIDISVFTRASDYTGTYIRSLDSVEQLLRRQEFWDADIHMFEFAMRYDLFDSVFVIPHDRRIVVTEHNTTPPELVDDPVMKRECELSLVQRQNMALAHRVICDSEFNMELDRRIGLPDGMLTVMHLPPGHRPFTETERPENGSGRRRVRLLYVGRFVRAKGIGDLLAAVEALWNSGENRFDLTLVGNPAFAEETVAHRVSDFAQRHDGDGMARMVTNAGDEELAALYAHSDALVIPSYHEGYCVPAVEALTAGRYVIGYDAGNLPNVLGGLGSLVPAGDVDALAEAISAFIDSVCEADASGADEALPTDRGSMSRTGWSEAVTRHLEGYSQANYERLFLAMLEEMSSVSPAGTPASVRAAISRRVTELAHGDGPSA